MYTPFVVGRYWADQLRSFLNSRSRTVETMGVQALRVDNIVFRKKHAGMQH